MSGWTACSVTALAAIPTGRIPDFVGAAATAEQLSALPAWQRAHVLKANPDQAQLPVRVRALREGKLIYMVVPKLADPVAVLPA